MKKQESENRRQIGLILWFILMMNVLIFLLAIIFGNSVGFLMSLKAHFWLALIMTIIFLLMLFVVIFLDFLLEFMEEKIVSRKGK